MLFCLDAGTGKCDPARRRALLDYSIAELLIERDPSYRGADKSLARTTSLCILFDGENISFDASLVLYTYIYIYIYNYGPGVDSASNRNEYQEYFLGVKTAGA